MPRVVVMGVAGCGKSTVGQALARELGVDFLDGDDLHPPANVQKMAAGVPLTDGDRGPWLADVARWLGSRERGVIACSALKRAYRDAIRAVVPDAVFVHLSVPLEELVSRVRRRRKAGHFMGVGMLSSQFSDLERLGSDENGITIEVVRLSPSEVCEIAKAWLTLPGR
jgi:carbohydrate kinase (thermoresistant glucokinase family)